LEREAWITRTNSSHDRRCKMVLLGRRAQRVITLINATAEKLRHELLADIAKSDLQTCVRVLARIRDRAEKGDRRESSVRRLSGRVSSEHNGQTKQAHSNPKRRAHRSANGGSK
jgi:hypothetical protein